MAHDCVMVPLSTPASTREAVEASAAWMRIRTLCPANAETLTEAVAHAPSRLTAAPSCWNTCVPLTETRKKSAEVAFDPCARYQENDSVSVPVAGRVIAGDWIEVVPPSTSKSPAPAPAAPPVTRSNDPLTVVPSCLGPLELVSAGLARSHCPVVAVSVADGLVAHPVAVSNVSE